MEEVTALCPSPPCSEDQLSRTGKDNKLHLFQPLYLVEVARRKSGLPKSHGMLLDL